MYKKLVGQVSKLQSNEYACHISFVCEIASKLANKYCPKSVETVRLAALLHDVGRNNELAGESHAEAGARIAKRMLEGRVEQADLEIIENCIRFHNSPRSNGTIEEKVITTADALSKVLFHEAFMLLCKKTNPKDRAIWGQKYLNKGYGMIMFPVVQKEASAKFTELNDMYTHVLNNYATY